MMCVLKRYVMAKKPNLRVGFLSFKSFYYNK